MKLTEARLRDDVKRKLGQALSDEQWAYVRDNTTWVDTVLQGDENVAWLIAEIRKMLGLFGATPEQATKTSESLRETRSADTHFWGLSRQDALCTALAALAERDAGVRAFRRDALGEQLLTYTLDSSRESVETWITRKVEQEQSQRAAMAGDLPLLTYIKFIGRGVETTPVAPGGVLDQLRQLAERLADQYHWEPAAAAAFVLTDAQPNVATFRITIRPNHQLSALTRVVIEVDPARLPEEVAEAYRQVRNRLMRSRPRAMSEKHLGLGAFAATRPPREPLAQQMAAWNAMVPDPDWSYEKKQPTNFARDRAKALARLVQPDYQLPAQQETTPYDDFRPDDDKDTKDIKDTKDHTDDESDDA